MISFEELNTKLEEYFSDTGDKVELRDLAGDGKHYSVTIISPKFANKSRIAQHKIVYAALGNYIKDNILHALSIQTKTPE